MWSAFVSALWDSALGSTCRLAEAKADIIGAGAPAHGVLVQAEGNLAVIVFAGLVFCAVAI